MCEFLHGGVEVNSRETEGNTPLFYASGMMVLYLERLGADSSLRNDQGDTPLHFMIRRNTPNVSGWFLTKHGGEIDAQNNEGDTALHIAVRTGVRQGFYMAQMLIERGADRWKINHQGQTPLDCITDPESRSQLERVEVRVDSSMRGAELDWEEVDRKLAELGMLPRNNG